MSLECSDVQTETLLPVIHHPKFLSVLPFGGKFQCCVRLRCRLRLWLGFGLWARKMLGDCIIIHDVPCFYKNSLSLKTCTIPQTHAAAFAQTRSAGCSRVEGSTLAPLESKLPSESNACIGSLTFGQVFEVQVFHYLWTISALIETRTTGFSPRCCTTMAQYGFLVLANWI